ncbi:helix-turn-helix domain-containing protein [Cerasicoccus maritimus]|uniref:helix-turn-helix domain-containing protein n=1 Tax=Cerasicoccus maritimus TaxID=490089 RepID=UPI0028526945|nr:helix-turn-helix domain-containing protein [Cerasicoccus maritimus]
MPQLASSPRIIIAGKARHDQKSPNRIRRPQGLPHWLLEYTTAGEACMHLSGQDVTVGKHSLFLYEPGAPQSYENHANSGAWTHYWVCFQPRSEWIDWMRWPREDTGFGLLPALDPTIANHVKSCFIDLVKVFLGPLPQRQALAMSLLEQLLLWSDSANPNTAAQRLDSRVRRAMAYICEHYREPLTLDAIAAASGISISRLAHLFPQEIGVTPMRYLEQHRIEVARQRLAGTTDSITTIAEHVGYGSASYFSKVFRANEGCTPRECRTRANQG